MKIGQMVKSPRQFALEGLTREALLPLYSRLKELEYTEYSVFERLGIDDIDDLLIKYLPVYLNVRLVENTHLDVLIKLFILARDIVEQDMLRLFKQGQLDLLLKIGLLEKKKGKYNALVDLYPCQGGFFASDHKIAMHFPPNTVYPLDLDSFLLARSLYRKPVDKTLDLCTGCGIQAIIASRYSKHVVGVDRNPRAVNFATFNALLNQADNTEFFAGDMYGPVEGRSFDWIIANPPFVPSPEKTMYFRHGSESGELLVKRCIQGLPYFIKPGGYVQMVSSLVMRKDEDYLDKIKKWLGGDRFHMLVTGTRYNTVDNYIRDHITTDPRSPEYHQDLITWVRAYKEQGIVLLGDGLINMKEAAGDKPVKDFRNFRVLKHNFSQKIRQFMDACTMANAEDAEERLMTMQFRISPDVDYYWEGSRPNGETVCGALFKTDAFYMVQNIIKDEKTMLDVIAHSPDAVCSGAELKRKYRQKSEYAKTLLALMRKCIVEEVSKDG